VEQILEPYSLVAKSSSWYLIARRDGELRTYRVTRFHTLVLLDTCFSRSEDFDLPTYWQQHVQEFVSAVSDYTFTLRFHESRLPFVRGLMPGRSTIIEPGDADGWVCVQLHVESMDLAKMLVFGLGTQVVVVDPPELHTAVVQAAREILNLK
jgi:predicted DNA-binding transcriptional regulator YafY